MEPCRIDFDGGDSNLYGYVLGDPVGFVDPEGLFVPLAYVVYTVGAYYTYQGLTTLYNFLEKAKNSQPREFTDPRYNQQICDTANEAREAGKELGYDILGAGIPFNGATRDAGGLIYDVAQ